MPRFVFTGPSREYVTLNLHAHDGDVRDFDTPPDHRWKPVQESEPAVTEETDK